MVPYSEWWLFNFSVLVQLAVLVQEQKKKKKKDFPLMEESNNHFFKGQKLCACVFLSVLLSSLFSQIAKWVGFILQSLYCGTSSTWRSSCEPKPKFLVDLFPFGPQCWLWLMVVFFFFLIPFSFMLMPIMSKTFQN